MSLVDASPCCVVFALLINMNESISRHLCEGTLVHHFASTDWPQIEDFGKSQLKQSVRLREAYGIYHKECFRFYYYF